MAGTSLVVSPANSVVYRCGSSAKATVRVVVNNEPVGAELGLDFGGSERAKRDLFVRGDCDDVFLQLAAHLGWVDGLEAVADKLPEQSRERLARFASGASSVETHR